MRAILDTHALLWWLSGSPRLSRRARDMIGDTGRNEVLVSAASAWEISTKARRGRLPEALTIAVRLPEILREQQFATRPISLEHCHRAGWIRHAHADPFDRILAAQSIEERLPVITADRKLAELGAATIW